MCAPTSTTAFHRCMWLCALALLVLGCAPGNSSPTPTVVILGAASTKDLLEEMAAAAESSIATPIEIEISTGPSHALAQQILSGAPVDLYVSANRQWADAIVDAGLASASIDWLANRLVVVVPKDARVPIDRLEDLASADVQRVAIAGENVPAGIYAQEALSYYQLWESLQTDGKIIRGHDVRSALAYAQRGEVDAAIVYATDAQLTEDVRVIAKLDPASHTPVVYPLLLLRNDREAAQAVYQFLQADEARQIAERHGFQMLTPSQGKE